VRGRSCRRRSTTSGCAARRQLGSSVRSESAVGASGEALVSLELQPSSPPAFPDAVEALRRADLVLLGPGSLYTSILPNLMIPAIRRVLQRRRGKVALLLNLMTQPGETSGMSAIEHLEAIERHAGRGLVDLLLVNATPLPSDPLELYEATGSEPVPVAGGAFAGRGIDVVAADLLAAGDLIRHDPAKLARAVVGLLAGPGAHGGAKTRAARKR
jgi:uncharacterized cofD-like protein